MKNFASLDFLFDRSSSAAEPMPPPPYLFIEDTFTRSNNPSTLGDVEQPVVPIVSWIPAVGTWGVLGGAAYCSDAVEVDPIVFANAFVDTIYSNLDLRVKCFQSSLDGGYAQVLYRFVSSTEYYYFQRNPLGDVTLYRTNGTDVLPLGQAGLTSELDTFYQMRLVVIGVSHKLYINDVLVLDVVDGDPNSYSGTHGLGVLSGVGVGSPGTRYKDFYITAP